MPSNRLEVLIAGSAADFNRTLDEVNSKVERTFGEIQTQAQNVSVALGAVSAAGGLLISSFVSKASEMEGFGATLERVMGSAQAGQAELKRLAEFAANTPFDLPGVVQAGISLRSLGVDAEKFLPLAGDLASVFRKDVTEGALALGKALSGSQDGIQSLADTYGISRQQMAEFGAATKADGSIAVETAADLEKLQGALEKIVSSKYGGAMAAQSQTLAGVLSNLSDSVGQFAADMGKEFLPAVKDAAGFLSGLMTALREMDPATKGMIASTLLVGTALAGIVAAISGVIAVLGPAAAAYVFYTQATTAAAAAQAVKAAAAQAAVAAEVAAAVATQATAAAAVEQALAWQAAAVGEAEAAVAAELLAAAEAELAVATEAVAVAQGNVAATALPAAAATGIFAKGLAGANAAAAAIPLTLGPALVIVGALAIAFGLYTSHLSATSVEIDRQTATEAHAITALHEKRDITIAAADAIKQYGDATAAAVDQMVASAKKLGQTDLDMTKSIAGTMVQLAHAEEQGDKAQVERLTKRIELLKKTRHELAGTYQEQERLRSEEQTKAKKVEADRVAAIEDYKKKASAGFYATAKEQMAALDLVLKSAKKTDKDLGDLTLERVKLARKATDEEAKAAEDLAKKHEEARKKTVDGELHKLDLVVGSDQAATTRRIAMLDELLKRTDLSLEERQRLEVDHAKEQDSLTKAQAAAHKKAEDDKKKATKEAMDARLKLRDAESKGADEALEAVREQFKEGKATAQQLQEQIKLRAELAAKINLEKAAQEGLGKSAKARADIIKAAEAENAAAAKKTSREVENIDKEAGKRKAKEAQTDADLKLEQSKSEEDRLKAQLDAGGKVGQKLLDQVKKRQQTEQEALVVKADAQKLDASAADQALIDKQLQVELLQLKRQQKAEIREITDELKRQKQEAQKKDDGFTLGKIGTDANDFSAFDITKPKETDKKLKDLEADQAAAQAETDRVMADRKELGGKKEPAAGRRPIDKPPSPGDVATNATLEAILKVLQKIESQPNEVVVKNSGLATEKQDWRLSTNKQQGAH